MTLNPNRQPDVEAEVTFLSEAEGGRAKPAISGYRPAHLVLDDYLTSGEHRYIGQDMVPPGESCTTHIWFITPEYYPRSLWPGKVIRVQEGGKLVGHAKITEVFNDVLRKSS